MKPVLLTGIATLDIINFVNHYPDENSEIRALAQDIHVGGNASNTSIVLQQLNQNAHLLATRADDVSAQQIFSELNATGTKTHLCPIQKNSTTPTSYITINTENGSRSIIHYRDLNELSAGDFCSIDLSHYGWLHFEARNPAQLKLMLKHASGYSIPVSLELEKERANIDELMPYAHLLLISKPFAKSRGFTQATDCLAHFSTRFPDKIITCTWGSKGAWAYQNLNIIHQPATRLNNIVETLGAGDTFNAAMIACLHRQTPLPEALRLACQLAEKKCQQTGFNHLSFNHH